jgi:hypothetical protein
MANCATKMLQQKMYMANGENAKHDIEYESTPK